MCSLSFSVIKTDFQLQLTLISGAHKSSVGSPCDANKYGQLLNVDTSLISFLQFPRTIIYRKTVSDYSLSSGIQRTVIATQIFRYSYKIGWLRILKVVYSVSSCIKTGYSFVKKMILCERNSIFCKCQIFHIHGCAKPVQALNIIGPLQ